MAKLMLVAACALIDADGRILLAKRREGGSMKAIAAAYSYILWRRENAGRAYDVN